MSLGTVRCPSCQHVFTPSEPLQLEGVLRESQGSRNDLYAFCKCPKCGNDFKVKVK